ncbi:surfeit locus protein 2-like [Lineus longissimus]|uniref:surfeit locus protein 2-like n=1 Tax=Lineus longissimus TaxID=88925 RepID=UPI002B4E6291
MATSKPEARVLGEIQELLNLYSNLSLVGDGKKVKCRLSGHEMPCKPEAINSYLEGKKFKKLQSHKEFDYEKYKQHLVPNKKKKHENQLFCKLTLRTLNKQPVHVLRHVNGKRFKRALARWEECKKNGEKFIPRGKRRKQDSIGDDESESPSQKNEGESGASGDESDVDSLSDLHPAKDFESEQEGEEEEADSDFDFEEEEIDDLPVPPSNGDAKGKKSKGAASVSSPFSGKGKKSKGETEKSKSQNTKGKNQKSSKHVEEEVLEPIKKAKKRKSEESSTKPKKAKFEKMKTNSVPKKVKQR